MRYSPALSTSPRPGRRASPPLALPIVQACPAAAPGLGEPYEMRTGAVPLSKTLGPAELGCLAAEGPRSKPRTVSPRRSPRAGFSSLRAARRSLASTPRHGALSRSGAARPLRRPATADPPDCVARHSNPVWSSLSRGHHREAFLPRRVSRLGSLGRVAFFRFLPAPRRSAVGPIDP